jgi:copper(I)-binding protein
MLRNLCSVLCGLIFTAFGSQLALCQVTIEGAYIRQVIPGQKATAAYLRLRNQNIVACRFVSVEADIAERTEFHSHVHVDGMMKMRPVKELVVPQGAVLEFRPGGLHLMLFITESLGIEKSSSTITFRSPECGDVTQLVPIRNNIGQNSVKEDDEQI